MNNWELYEARKQRYLQEHPDATPQEIEEYCKKLAKELNI